VNNLIDTHCHLDDPQFGVDTSKVIHRARENGIEQMVCVGTDLESTQRCIELAERYSFIYAAAGVHPHFADKVFTPEHFQPLVKKAGHPRVVAIGETGLDYYKKFARPERQQELLRQHLRLSETLNKPLVIHCRDAHDDFFRILQQDRKPPVKGVMHCFSSTRENARKAMDWGLYISIAGPVTYPNAASLADVVKYIPLDRLVVETDSPYLAPQANRGQRNEPAYVRFVAEKIAELQGIAPDVVCERTTLNARALFGISA
jgi:TatD DNase family protein